MKRATPLLNPTVVVRPIPPLDRVKSRNQSQNRERFPCEIGSSYVSVPVFTSQDNMSGKPVVDVAATYSVCTVSPYSFVISLKSDPSARIAVPCYRTEEKTVSGKRYISVSNFYPKSTLQATPPVLSNMIGRRARLFHVRNDSLKSIFVCPSTERSGNMMFQARELSAVSSGRSNLSQMSDGSTQSSYVVTPLSTPRLHSVPSSSSEGQSKRVKLSAESEVITQSYWKGEQFVCIHSASDDHLPSSLDFQKSADYSLFRDLLSFLVTQQSLSLSDISKAFLGNESTVLRMANIFVALQILQYLIPQNGNEGNSVYRLNVERDGGERLDNEGIMTVQRVNEIASELSAMRHRVAVLERLSSMWERRKVDR